MEDEITSTDNNTFDTDESMDNAYDSILANRTAGNTFDGETVDLFAVMNSTVLELQMEMDFLENREYEDCESKTKPNPATVGTDDESTPPTTPPPPTMYSAQSPRSEKSHQSLSIPHVTPNGSESLEETLESVDYDDDDDETNFADENLDTIGEVAIEKAPVEWEQMEPSQSGDDDYVPVADYSAKVGKGASWSASLAPSWSPLPSLPRWWTSSGQEETETELPPPDMLPQLRRPQRQREEI
jgi:hypothetical protein